MKDLYSYTFLAASAVIALVSTNHAQGTERAGTKAVAVIELFTSQGCSSCPPADAVLEKLAIRDGVIALAYHVDYWDYLGWKDTLGSKENTAHQYAYTDTLGTRSVYTPQAVINGAAHTNGADRKSVDRLMTESEPLPVDVSVTKDAETYRASLAGVSSGQAIKMRLACYVDQVSVDIGRGENAGREVAYVNAVTGSRSLGQWMGQPVAFDLEQLKGTAESADGCVIIAQEVTGKGAPARIVGATVLPRF